MSRFIANFLEPFPYLIYTGIFLSFVSKGKDFKKTILLFYYIFASTVIFYACWLAHVVTQGDNNWLYNLFFLVTIVVLSYYFHHLIDHKDKRNAILIILLINLVLFVWYDIIQKKFHLSYNNYVVTFSFLSVIIYSFLYFHQLVTNVNEHSILTDFDFWLVSGYLFYFLGSFFVILFYSNAPVEQRRFVWAIQNILLFLSALITLSGNLWISHKKKLA